jgi:ubiquinone/menaquinone biosynthesis C-methylase UbiE
VQQHFQRGVDHFDSIYTGQKSSLGRRLDQWLRWDMTERLRLALDACHPLEGRSVLDAGCGTGRFCLPLAKAGAGQVVGIDFAPAMIARAQVLTREQGLDGVCRFLVTDIMAFRPPDPFDYVLAIGLFDYIQDDLRLLARLRQLTRGKAIMTFPRADTWRAPIRRMRLGLQGCPVYFYTEKQIRDHLLISGFHPQKVLQIGKLYFVEAE